MPKDNKTRYAILGLLTHEPLTGYDIKKRIEASISYFWDAGFGQIYPTLQKLEAGGLVTKIVEHDENRPSRKVYTITGSGLAELKQWLNTPVEKETLRYEILLKLFFGSQISAESNIKNIRGFQARNLTAMETFSKYEQSLRAVLADNPDHLYYLLTVRFGQQIMNAYQTWANEAIELLTSISRKESEIKNE